MITTHLMLSQIYYSLSATTGPHYFTKILTITRLKFRNNVSIILVVFPEVMSSQGYEAGKFTIAQRTSEGVQSVITTTVTFIILYRFVFGDMIVRYIERLCFPGRVKMTFRSHTVSMIIFSSETGFSFIGFITRTARTPAG